MTSFDRSRSYQVDAVLPRLTEALANGPSAVLQAPPGSGKTTRVPLALLDAIAEVKGRIVMLEPRRIAAVSAAKWMSHLIGEEVGSTIGYSIRFDSRISSSTRIEVVTEGILTRRIQSDPLLEGVSLVIFDEFHERSLNADLALALCLDVRRGLREDLKLLVMSATLDSGPAASLLGGAPVISCSGRSFPVEEIYLPERPGRSLAQRIVDAVRRALHESSGDILVFLPGASEIRASAEALTALSGSRKDALSVHPLYADLPFERQEQALLPAGHRKVVLATTIAETGLTIEGVGAVIDSGLTRRLQYDPATGMNRLITVSVSRASAEQRKGRAGRLGPGVSYRLFSKDAFRAMVPYAPPEILVSDLSSLVLELAAWGVREPGLLSWLTPPPDAAWDAACSLLKDLGCLDPQGAITPEGRTIAGLPVHPRLGRLMVRAERLGRPFLGAELAALLSERDVLARGPSPLPRDPDVYERLEALHRWKEGVTTDGVDLWALRRTDKTARHLAGLLTGKKRSAGDKTDDDFIPILLLAAFPDRIGKRRDEGDGRFLLAQGRGVRISPSSRPGNSEFIVAVNVDAGTKAEGFVHMAVPVTLEQVRSECGRRIERMERAAWDRRAGRIVSVVEERIGSVVLSSKPSSLSDEQATPILCGALKADPDMLTFSRDALQYIGRVSLVSKTFPGDDWPDMSREYLSAHPEEWLLPWFAGLRSRQEISRFDLMPALRSTLSPRRQRLLDELAPVSLTVPSGRRVSLDYTQGEIPVLAVKLQEMFGLADTPAIAGGRVKVVLHLLSPAGRPVQITQDLKTFWDSAYRQVRSELRGRYPKHPWPDDPWTATPTRKTKPRNR